MLLPVVVLSVFAAIVGARFWWRQQQARRAQALLDIVDDGLPHVDVRSGVRQRVRRRAGQRRSSRGDSSTETWFAAELTESATLRLEDPATCTAPHRLDNPLEPKVIAVWGSEALVARAMAHEGLLRHMLTGEGRRAITDGTVHIAVHGELDAMGRAALISEVGDVVRALEGMV